MKLEDKKKKENIDEPFEEMVDKFTDEINKVLKVLHDDGFTPQQAEFILFQAYRHSARISDSIYNEIDIDNLKDRYWEYRKQDPSGGEFA